MNSKHVLWLNGLLFSSTPVGVHQMFVGVQIVFIAIEH
jgi:hypothetical protein